MIIVASVLRVKQVSEFDYKTVAESGIFRSSDSLDTIMEKMEVKKLGDLTISQVIVDTTYTN